jgi:hypothetical protein
MHSSDRRMIINVKEEHYTLQVLLLHNLFFKYIQEESIHLSRTHYVSQLNPLQDHRYRYQKLRRRILDRLVRQRQLHFKNLIRASLILRSIIFQSPQVYLLLRILNLLHRYSS